MEDFLMIIEDIDPSNYNIKVRFRCIVDGFEYSSQPLNFDPSYIEFSSIEQYINEIAKQGVYILENEIRKQKLNSNKQLTDSILELRGKTFNYKASYLKPQNSDNNNMINNLEIIL